MKNNRLLWNKTSKSMFILQIYNVFPQNDFLVMLFVKWNIRNYGGRSGI